ncbi:MAG: hypothetical protein ABIH77_04090 [Pseudomonadota bacterium]|nr:hypothetical protein [Gammaproteobacteria bacterium]MBU1559108.1 hypothetical protein [Gammaproteobacteria bacterium]MBU1927047.1 hypothetical protein [Gammaproteobacteria bacterium]MBU2545860.1 hypothetical protein [Gammaproteobacteria bacterium]
MKRFLAIFVLFLMTFSSGAAFAGATCDNFMYYFKNPQSTRLVPNLKCLLDNNYLQVQAAIKPAVHFFAAAIRNSNKEELLLHQLDQLKAHYSGDQQAIIDSIIQETKHFRSPPADSDLNFDLLWSEFFATGSAEPVRKIASYLKLDSTESKTAITCLASAEWSLASNAAQLPRVLKILKDLYPSSTGIMKRRLKRIIDDPKGAADLFYNASTTAPNFKAFTAIVW